MSKTFSGFFFKKNVDFFFNGAALLGGLELE